MEFKSNITLASNIYHRVSSDIKSDPNFIANVRGGIALREMDRRLHGVRSVKLNEVQRYELSESVTCSTVYNYLREVTHGPIRRENGVVWQCRCENTKCVNYTQCMPVPIIRELDPVDYSNAPVSTDLEFEWLGTIERIFDEPDYAEEIIEIEDESIPLEFTESPAIISNDFTELDSPEIIVEADIGSRIFVNAGPGTGKTYTVIERLAYIIDSGEVDLGQVLVLCYTNAARDVILSRLEEKGLAAEARQLVICTLDSLAWSNLSEKTEDDLLALGYNGCIKKFNVDFDEEEWTGFEYVIIDELQDLVNDRARMALKILKALQCGYLLLGDKCQAIYDYDCNEPDSVSSVKFYAELEKLFPETIQKYELMGNKRQTDELSRLSNNLREALLWLNIKDANTYFHNKISRLPMDKFRPNTFTYLPDYGTTAILTRNNGEAEWVSSLLHKENIRHILLRSVNQRPSLNRWIADMFWDYREQHISREEFIERYVVRLNSDEIRASEAYNALFSSLSPEASKNGRYLKLTELNQALKKGQNLSPLLTNALSNELTVSTIHKAKGREFDHVYLLSGFAPTDDNTEEARVWYVGSTRPKSRLDALALDEKLFISKPTNMKRRMKIGWRKVRWKKSAKKVCTNIIVGLPQDIDNYSFINGDLHQALEIQKYIANSLAINDTVELIKSDKVYSVVHKGNTIGALNAEVTDDFRSAISSLEGWKSIPPRLTDMYISNIVTVIPDRFPRGVDAMFKYSKFWLGVELTGFAKTDWHYGGTN